MAGNYMDAPASRLSYDRDGSIGAFFTNVGLMAQLTAAQLRTLNGETEGGVAMTSQSRIALVFPAPVDIAGVFFAVNQGGTTNVRWSLETSVDTTTGIDGTWVTHRTGLDGLRDVKPNYRILNQLWLTNPGASSQGVRGVRLTANNVTSAQVKALHVYADISNVATLDRLAFWHPTLDQEVPPAYFDWGNVPRGSSADRSFRIKNLSSDLTAQNVSVYAEALTPGSPSVASMITLSGNGGSTFLNGVDLPPLSPGQASGLLIARRTVPSNAQVSVWSARIAADVAQWTE